MDLIRRIARLERRLRAFISLRSPVESELADMEYALNIWFVYGRPGEPPPTEPLTRAEIEAVLDAVYDRAAAPMSARRAPPPPYVLLWQRTGQVTHPLLRYLLTARNAGRDGHDDPCPEPDPPAVEPQPDAFGPDLPPVGPGALP